MINTQSKKILFAIILTIVLFLGACALLLIRSQTRSKTQPAISGPTRFFSLASPTPEKTPTPTIALIPLPRTSSKRAVLSFSPASIKKSSTESAVLGVQLNPGNYHPEAAELYLLYDPKFIDLLDIKDNKLFATMEQATASGEIKISLTGKTDKEATISGEILTLTFKLLKVGKTAVRFDSKTRVIDSGKNITGELKVATISIR